MKVIDLIHSNKKTAFSFEILPPLKGTGIEKLYQTIDTLREFDPKYINITTHRSEYVYKDLGNGLFQRNRLRRRPGTVAVAAAIQNKYNITVVPHILCSGFTREETEYVLLDLQFLNITELLVLRGDKAKHESVFTPEGDGYHHAIELQEQINNFNKGIFVDGSEMKVSSTPFSYGVACYPEKHEEAPNIETDLYWLKKKVENVVAVSNRSVLNGQKSCVLLLNLLELCFHILRLHSCIHLLYLNALVLAQGHFRPYGYSCGIDERLVLANLLYGNFRSGNDLQSAFIHCLHAGCVDGLISSLLIKDAFAIHLFNHGARCFALTEAWNIKLVLALIEGFFHSILKLLCA